MFQHDNGNFQDVELDGEVVKLHHTACLEFGGVGKGYALDKIVKRLASYENFLVDFGGDIYGR